MRQRKGMWSEILNAVHQWQLPISWPFSLLWHVSPVQPMHRRIHIVVQVDHCREDPWPTTMALSLKAFRTLSMYSSKINVEFIQ